MRCDWQSYVNVLPLWMREIVDKQGRDTLWELRMRIGSPPELVTSKGSIWMQRQVEKDDLLFCINTASHYSPWIAATMSQGFITAPGGHRLGICGVATVQDGRMTGIRLPTSICFRVARQYDGISEDLCNKNGSILIIGKPGSGKTTLLRDLIRQKSDTDSGSICVIDEKSELFPIGTEGFSFQPGSGTDVLTRCSKREGIDVALRNMGPSVIAVDEITAADDCKALMHAGWCGVTLFATAHASNRSDLMNREIYRPLIESRLFDFLVVMQPDKSWRLERINT